MNLLFLLKGLEMGGVEVVTSVLAQKFIAEGHDVSIFALIRGDETALSRFPNETDIQSGVGVSDCNDNVIALRKMLKEHHIDYVINQWVFPYAPIKTLIKACKGLDVKVVSVYHNDPLVNGRLQEIDVQLACTSKAIKRQILLIKKVIFRSITAQCMRYCYDHSLCFFVLSPSYIVNFKKFTGLKHTDHLISLTNPVTIDNSNYVYDFSKKQKEVIYCGRIDYNQKRVSRLIDVWNIIENKCPDWKLTIVGDGVSRKEVEDKAKLYGLKSVHFDGFQQPLEYYKRASILVLTSEYEGFPLVLAECMSFGVVPVVLDSFAAAKDIVHHQKNGVLVPYDKKSGFDSVLYASMLKNVMNDDLLRQEMSLAAIETSKEYSIDTIYKQWMKVFEDLKVRP